MVHSHDCTHPQPLTARQQAAFEVIAQFYRAIGEGASTSYLARKLAISRPRAHRHIEALHEKGWLLAPSSPATPNPEVLTFRNI
jgi:SOS-response transcriptional repressor LexA